MRIRSSRPAPLIPFSRGSSETANTHSRTLERSRVEEIAESMLELGQRTPFWFAKTVRGSF
jgi:hypothetical protein